ncbi:MAG: cytochrome c biogenesis protein CcsA [Planctomycetes bacterium]|nr:cytochrome c biogenesis protein CcsA [Planctomycetota bacterium]
MSDRSFRAIRFAGRVHFTMILLAVGIGLMVVGTVVESRDGADAAWSAVYGTLAFDLFLALIGVNLVVAVVNRLPLRRSQWPFALTHASIVLLLLGALVSRTAGREGVVAIRENEAAREMDLETAELRIEWRGNRETVQLGRAPDLGPVRLATADAPELRIVDVAHDKELRVGLGEGKDGDGPGIGILLRSPSWNRREWLLAERPYFRRKDVGPVEVEYLVAQDEEILRDWLPARSCTTAQLMMSFGAGGENLQVDLPGDVGIEKRIGAMSVLAERYLPHARVIGQELTDDSESPVNPAAIVTVRSGDRAETHTVFSQMPQFNLVKGRDGDGLVRGITLVANGVKDKTLVRVIARPDGRHWVQLQAPSERGEGWPLVVDRPVVLGSLGIDIVLESALARAQPTVELVPAGERGSGSQWIKVASRDGESVSEGWIQYGAQHSLRSEDGQVTLTYAPRRFELPFTIRLRSFAVDYHQGSPRASQYRSHVSLTGDDGGVIEAEIAMNRPLDHQGYRIFQSSFVPAGSDGVATTVLTVSSDPGASIVYAAMVLLVLGVAWYVRGHVPARSMRVPSRTGAGMADDSGAGAARRIGTLASGMVLAFALPSLAAQEPAAVDLPVEATRAWPIQGGGRVKPLEVMAQEWIVAVTGKRVIDGCDPLGFLWGFHFTPDELRKRPWLVVDSRILKLALGLPAETRRFSFDELLGNPSFQALVEGARAAPGAGVELTQVARDALVVYEGLEVVAGIMDGSSLRILPTARADGTWASLAELRDDGSETARRMLASLQGMSDAFRSKSPADFATQVAEFERLVLQSSGGALPERSALRTELLYHDLDAFGRAWAAYLLGVVFLFLFHRRRSRWTAVVGRGLIAVGCLLHSTGIILRWTISGRAPVSDMYESLVFMSWGIVALGLGMGIRHGGRVFASCAAAAGSIVLMIAEMLPLDSAINPLLPVLAHTAWLSVHVMTVMLSYSAFALAMALGHVALGIQLLRPGSSGSLAYVSGLIHRTIQIGLLFLTAGIVFGAMWANESWGRYWGWDPKETWSLVTFFVYLLVVHARFAGWLGHFGMAMAAIVGFLSVVMTYYGVNFLLAAGLHSYGFSDGGVVGAGIYVAVECGVLCWAIAQRRPIALPPGAAGLHPTG